MNTIWWVNIHWNFRTLVIHMLTQSLIIWKQLWIHRHAIHGRWCRWLLYDQTLYFDIICISLISDACVLWIYQVSIYHTHITEVTIDNQRPAPDAHERLATIIISYMTMMMVTKFKATSIVNVIFVSSKKVVQRLIPWNCAPNWGNWISNNNPE